MLTFALILIVIWNLALTFWVAFLKIRVTTLEIDRDTTWTELDLARHEMRGLTTIKP